MALWSLSHLVHRKNFKTLSTHVVKKLNSLLPLALHLRDHYTVSTHPKNTTQSIWISVPIRMEYKKYVKPTMSIDAISMVKPMP